MKLLSAFSLALAALGLVLASPAAPLNEFDTANATHATSYVSRADGGDKNICHMIIRWTNTCNKAKGWTEDRATIMYILGADNKQVKLGPLDKPIGRVSKAGWGNAWTIEGMKQNFVINVNRLASNGKTSPLGEFSVEMVFNYADCHFSTARNGVNSCGLATFYGWDTGTAEIECNDGPTKVDSRVAPVEVTWDCMSSDKKTTSDPNWDVGCPGGKAPC